MKRSLVVMVLVLLGFAVAMFSQEKPKDSSKPVEIIQPTKEWLAGLDEFLVLDKVVKQMKVEAGIDKLEDRLNQKFAVLKAQIPAGYSYDDATKTFKLIKPEPKK